MDEWIRAYRAGKFQALCPLPRQVGPLTPARVLCLAEQLKRELPERTAAQVHAIMVASGEQVPALRTLQRHFASVGLNVRADGRGPDRGPPPVADQRAAVVVDEREQDPGAPADLRAVEPVAGPQLVPRGGLEAPIHTRGRAALGGGFALGELAWDVPIDVKCVCG